MSKRKRKARPAGGRRPAQAVDTPAETPPPVADEGTTPAPAEKETARPWLLAATTAVFVARPLLPSESVARSGEGTTLVMLSLLLLVAWALDLLRRRRRALRIGPTDVAVFALLAVHSATAVWAAQLGDARAAINMLWAWMGLGVGFFLVRQLVRSTREARAMVAVMIGLAVGLSGYGLYQYVVELPETRRAYERDPDGMLRADGRWYEPGSAARAQFEQRLASREPFATFALTNSLAGYLAPWLVAAIGVAALGRWKNPTGILLVVLLATACLLLTKSRAAFLATLLGVGLVALLRVGRGRSIGWRWPVAGVGAIAVLVVGAIVAGGLDAEVLSEAGKSFGYRVQYWQSTLAMIQDSPWRGCGPGQFQNRYTGYKLPEASEEIADPHNFVFEIWATTGTLGLAAMLAVAGCFGWAAWKYARRSSQNSAETKRGEASRTEQGEITGVPGPKRSGGPVEESLNDTVSSERADDAMAWIYGGALAGMLVAWPLGIVATSPLSLALLAIGVPLAAASVALLAPWVQHGRLPISVIVISMTVLLVNLLAAGGIGTPGVAGTLWLLLAVGLCLTDEGRAKSLPSAVAWLLLIGAAGGAAACYATAYRPVLAARGPIVAAAFEESDRQRYLLEAAEADPLWPEPWKLLAQCALDDWRAGRTAESIGQFVEYSDRARRADPESSRWVGAVGDGLVEVYEGTSNREYLTGAIEAYSRAVELYPNKAEHHARLAIALHLDGQNEAARREAREAIRLDDAMPHVDKKLRPKLRQRLLRIDL